MKTEDIYKIYEERTQKSGQAWGEGRKYIPTGVPSYFNFYKPYPIYIDRAKGTRVYDVDGNEYIDFSICYGALIVGHAHPQIVEAIRKQAERGTMYTIPHKAAVELAKEIVKRFPIDQVRFTNSGVESTMHALRLARGYTGRDKVMKLAGAYHGLQDYLMTNDDPANMPGPAVAGSKGVPVATLQNTLVGIYNDLSSIQLLFDQNKGQIAAIIVEPVMMNKGIILPQGNFLKELLKLCHKEGALLIFDEVKTGVKIAPGGACEYYSIEPDIVCLAKSIGGGMPLGAFGARAKIMSVIDTGEVSHAGTYNANPISVVAGLVTLKDILTSDSYKELFRLNKKLTEGCDRIIAKYGLPMHTVSIGACGTIQFCKEPLKNYTDYARFVDAELGETFWISMLNHGIIPTPYPPPREHWTISVQHTDEDIDKYMEVFDKVAPNLMTRA